MTMMDAELDVLANMAVFPARAFDVAEQLHLRADDFSVAAHRTAFASLITKGPVQSDILLKLVTDALPALKRTDAALDAFIARAPSLATVDHALCAFAEGVARTKLQADTLAVTGDATLPAQLVPEALDKVNADFAERLSAIARVRGRIVPDVGDFDGSVPTPEELMDVPGFVNSLSDYTYRTAPRQNRVLAFAGALSMLSFLAGRKFTDRRKTMPNLYIVALAASAAGKDHPRKVNKHLLMDLNVAGGIADQIASGQGLEDALLSNPVRLFEMDEFDTLLNELKEKSVLSEGMMKYVLNFFSESGSYHTMRKKALTDREREALATGATTRAGDVVIPYPSLTLFATAIPEQFYGALSLRAMTNGLLARCLIFESGARGPRGKGPFIQAFPDEVLQTAQMLISRAEEKDFRQHPHLIVVPDEDGVEAAFETIKAEEDKLFSAAEREKDLARQAVWGRGVEIASKLALLYAISENPVMPRISVRGIEWAWKLVRYSADRMLKMAEAYVADDKEDADAQAVLRYVRQFENKGVMHSDVTYRLHLSSKRMQAAIQTLEERDLIESWSGKKGAMFYRAKKKGGKR